MRDKEGKKDTLPFIFHVSDLKGHLALSKRKIKEINDTSRVYPLKVSYFYLNLIDKTNPECPIKRQCIPDIKELSHQGEVDPLIEDRHSITPSFIKKYPGRGVFLTGAQCAVYCRFCNRKRLTGRDHDIKASHKDTFAYLKKDTSIQEVIVSGGDPMMLSPEELDHILSNLFSIDHIKTVRISSRVPLVYPEGITDGHINAIKKINPLWFIIHINHPREITDEFSEKIRILRETGCILLGHTVLLRGVNDCPLILAHLFQGLVMLGIKPYYLFQLDEVRGVMHFKVQVQRGIEIMKTLRRNISGLAMPTYTIDITGGSGKVPVDYNYIKRGSGDKIYIEDFKGRTGIYLDNGKKSICNRCGVCNKKA